jgi:hypothetical protein
VLLSLIVTLLMQTPRFMSPSCVPGEGWGFVIAGPDLAKSPRWKATDDAPPLTARAAERAAREFLRRAPCNDADVWTLHQIALQPLSGERDVWVYVIEYTEPLPLPKGAAVGSFIPRIVEVPVLLDGRVPTTAPGPWPPR